MDVGSTDERFWQVQAVFGCDKHPGPGFAYTIGLAGAGLRELHMWDQPTHGDDPGADFTLSSADLCHILNGFADEWVSGDLHVGDVRELSLDDGLTTAVVRFDEPVEADEVEAWGARPSMVVPLAWSLHRPTRGEPVEILADARGAYERDIRAAALACDPRVSVSGAQLPGDEISFDVAGQYGPLSALVAAHALAMVGSPRLDRLIDNTLAAETAMSPRALLGRMSTLSRLSGRDEQVLQVELLARRVMDRIEKRRAWRDQVAEIARQGDMSTSRAADNMRDLVGGFIQCTLVGLALDDVLPEAMVLSSQGPWRATMSSSGSDPGPRWRCSAEAEQLIRLSFGALDSCALLEVANFTFGPLGDVLEDDLMVVQGRALTRALAPPPVTDLVHSEFCATASIPAVQRELSLFAQLLVAMADGQLAIAAERVEAFHALVGPLNPDAWRAAPWASPTAPWQE